MFLHKMYFEKMKKLLVNKCKESFRSVISVSTSMFCHPLSIFSFPNPQYRSLPAAVFRHVPLPLQDLCYLFNYAVYAHVQGFSLPVLYTSVFLVYLSLVLYLTVHHRPLPSLCLVFTSQHRSVPAFLQCWTFGH